MAGFFILVGVLLNFIGMGLRMWALRSGLEQPPMTADTREAFEAQTGRARRWANICRFVGGLCVVLGLLFLLR